ncbi:MAG: DUF4340 domain-containing protein [Opitutales bacterium]|nr:DUF4340 domain-containing protein [Opitutales bacterium]
MFRFGLTVILTLLNTLWIALFAYQRFGDTSSSPEIHTLGFQRHLLDLQSVDMKFRDGTSMCFGKTASEWRMTAPADAKAHPLVMDRFLQVLSGLKPKFILKSDSEKDLAQYGLNPPFRMLTLQTSDKTYQLTVGKAMDEGERVYLFIPETREIFSVNGEFLNLLKMPPVRWSFPYLLDLATLKTIALETAQQKVLLDRTGATWSLKLPLPVPIDTQKADALSQQLRYLKIERFLADEEAQPYRQSFSDAEQTLRLILNDGKATETLKLLPKANDLHTYIAQRNNDASLFLIKTDAVERLLHAPETLCERMIFDLGLSQIRQITCRRQGVSTTLRPLDKNEWERSVHVETSDPSIQTQKVPAVRLQSLTDTLNMLCVKDFLPNAPNVSGKTRLELEITTLDDTLSATVYYDENAAYVKLSNQPLWMQPTSFDPEFFQTYFEFSEDKTVWKFNSNERVVRVKLKSPFKEVVETLSSADYKDVPLALLEADRWLEDKDLPTFSTDTYTLFITTENDAHIPKTYELTFSERIGGRLQIGGYAEKKFAFTPEWIAFLFRITHQKENDDTLRKFLKP